MKKIAFLLWVLISTATFAQGIKMPSPSPAQSLKQDFSLSSVEVKYSRPVIKGRKIFGDVVPFGKLWRTGANSPTNITLGEDVKISGQTLKAGTYQLLTIPSPFSWEIIFNKGTNGVFNYKPEEDVLKIKIASNVLTQSVESFTINFANVISNKMDLVLSWEKVSVSIPIETDIDSKIVSSIDKAMAADTRPYFESASYYFETGRDLNKALEWVAKAIEANSSAYWIWHLQAKIQAKTGNIVAAKASAEKSMA
jgi:hypothetical protein